MKAIINGKIITKTNVVEGKVLLFDKMVEGIVDEENSKEVIRTCKEIIDAQGNFISPGFIDMHIHGSGGSDVMDGTEEALDVISKSVTQTGVTSFLPTTMTMSKEAIFKALDNIGKCMNKEAEGAKILGAHLEV